MPGTLALVGAGEYLESMQPVDQHLLATIAQPEKRVVVLPTAAAQESDYDKWSRMGVTHFRGLGVAVAPVPVLTRADAARDDLAAQIAWANFVYLSGGSPGYLVSTLEGTRVWEAMRAVWEAGGVIAGCSAGAMALASAVRTRRDPPLDFRPGLGLVPRVTVIPHFDRIPPQRLASYLEHLPRDLILLGIDEHTAAVGGPLEWTVMGRGRVLVCHDGREDWYGAGGSFALSE
ncbi:MAG: Type 1 glutamine amidotransferase-like domain-containing protein [Chloroflexi bacterium]|nr:Type 1 glutamine amidotransferase-like domain-containing protein [Chloroflexota bacterium]